MATTLYLISGSNGTHATDTTRRGGVGDPLLALVQAFRVEAARIDADQTASDAHFQRLYDRLMNDTPECRTAEGAVEALQLVADDLEACVGGFHASVLASVQTFLSRRA